MTQAEKLETLVRKAIEWRWKSEYGEFLKVNIQQGGRLHVAFLEGVKGMNLAYEQVIYNKDFARALFGKNNYLINGEEFTEKDFELGSIIKVNGDVRKAVKRLPDWRDRRQQAVISDDPIGYMYKEVFGEQNNMGL